MVVSRCIRGCVMKWCSCWLMAYESHSLASESLRDKLIKKQQQQSLTFYLGDSHFVGSSGSFYMGAPSPTKDQGLQQVVTESFAEGRPDAWEDING